MLINTYLKLFKETWNDNYMFCNQLYSNIWSAVNNFSTTWRAGIVPTMHNKGYYNIGKYLNSPVPLTGVISDHMYYGQLYKKYISFVTRRYSNTLLRHGNGTLRQKNFTGTSRWVNKYVVHKPWLFFIFFKVVIFVHK